MDYTRGLLLWLLLRKHGLVCTKMGEQLHLAEKSIHNVYNIAKLMIEFASEYRKSKMLLIIKVIT